MTEILIELLVVLVMFGVVTRLRQLSRQRRIPIWGYWVVFLLILWGGLFVGISLPASLSAKDPQVFQIVGGVLVGVAVITLSAVWRTEDVTIQDPVFSRLFGDDLSKKVGEGDLRIPPHPELNARAFNRFARILRSFGHVTTESIEQKIVIGTAQKGGFYFYDCDVTLRYSTNSPQKETPSIIPLSIEVHPYREVRIATDRFPLEWGCPLQYDRPEDKWPGKFHVPLLDNGNPADWNMMVEQWNSVIKDIPPPICTMADLDSVGEPEHIALVGPEYREATWYVGAEKLNPQNVSFAANIRLGRRRRVALRYSLRNVPHPVDYFWMAWYASDLITNQWILEMHSEYSVFRDVLCIGTHEDLRVEVEGKGSSYLRVTVEPWGKTSVIMPYDCILVSLDPRSLLDHQS